MCDRCHIFTPDHFSILAHSTALIRRALHVLHVFCRLEKEKRKNLSIQMDVENWILLTTHWTGILLVQRVTLVVRHHCVSECPSQSKVTRLPTKKSLQGKNANLIPLKVPISPASVLDSLAKLVLTSCLQIAARSSWWCADVSICMCLLSIRQQPSLQGSWGSWGSSLKYHPYAVSEGVTVQSRQWWCCFLMCPVGGLSLIFSEPFWCLWKEEDVEGNTQQLESTAFKRPQ